jgi:peroxiredoxin
MREDIQLGVKLPDFTPTDQNGERVSLSEIQGTDPMVLILSRGHFCLKDHQQHLEIANFYPRFAVSTTKLVTIMTDPIFQLREFRDSVGTQWTFLSDTKRLVQQEQDIQEFIDTHHDPMIPYTFVLEPDLMINKFYNGYWFWGRPSVYDLCSDLREVFKKVRPDWDLSTSGLREN